eukprot:scaffold51067_cov66-Phaeocystis_antarctica.AAC.4
MISACALSTVTVRWIESSFGKGGEAGASVAAGAAAGAASSTGAIFCRFPADFTVTGVAATGPGDCRASSSFFDLAPSSSYVRAAVARFGRLVESGIAHHTRLGGQSSLVRTSGTAESARSEGVNS